MARPLPPPPSLIALPLKKKKNVASHTEQRKSNILKKGRKNFVYIYLIVQKNTCQEIKIRKEISVIHHITYGLGIKYYNLYSVMQSDRNS